MTGQAAAGRTSPELEVPASSAYLKQINMLVNSWLICIEKKLKLSLTEHIIIIIVIINCIFRLNNKLLTDQFLILYSTTICEKPLY